MAKKKSWKEKLLESKDLPKVEVITEEMNQKWGAGTFVIPAPAEVDEIMKTVPEGFLITTKEIREKLALKHKTDMACPLTTGIFTWIAANAAMEDREQGIENITPYWRTLKTGGILNRRYPGGVEEHKKQLEEEGFTVVKKGKNYIVKDYQQFIKL